MSGSPVALPIEEDELESDSAPISRARKGKAPVRPSSGKRKRVVAVVEYEPVVGKVSSSFSSFLFRSHARVLSVIYARRIRVIPLALWGRPITVVRNVWLVIRSANGMVKCVVRGVLLRRNLERLAPPVFVVLRRRKRALMLLLSSASSILCATRFPRLASRSVMRMLVWRRFVRKRRGSKVVWRAFCSFHRVFSSPVIFVNRAVLCR